MPLLTVRKRAILNAAPVKQNIPPEVLKELRLLNGDYSRMIEILHSFSKEEKTDIKDPVKILQVDLHQYDQLGLGKEVRNYESITY